LPTGDIALIFTIILIITLFTKIYILGNGVLVPVILGYKLVNTLIQVNKQDLDFKI